MEHLRVCPICLRDYKHSREGKAQRKRHLRQLEASWGHGRWPNYVYHSGQGRRCPKHSAQHWTAVQTAYDRRAGNLFALGFESYDAYLASPRWAEIRERCFLLFGRVCTFCGLGGEQIHHEDYEKATLLGLRMGALFVVCGGCHEHAEFAENGTKLTPLQATRRLRQIGKMRRNLAGYKARMQERRSVLANIVGEVVPALDERPTAPKLLPKRRPSPRLVRKIRKRAPFCPSCKVNRRFEGGPCPPCRRRAAGAPPMA